MGIRNYQNSFTIDIDFVRVSVVEELKMCYSRCSEVELSKISTLRDTLFKQV